MVRATDRGFEVVARMEVAASATWAHPVLLGNRSADQGRTVAGAAEARLKPKVVSSIRAARVGCIDTEAFSMRYRLAAVLGRRPSAIAVAGVSADNWPQWRGPSQNGNSGEKNPPLKWTATENVTWKVPMPNVSGSTPIIWGDSIFLSVAEGPNEGDAAVALVPRSWHRHRAGRSR